MSIHKRLKDLYELNNIIAKGLIKTDIYKLLLDFIDINGEKEFIEYFNKIIISFKSSKYYTIGNHLLNSINSFLDINDFISNIDNIKGGIKNNNINEFYNELHIFIINQLELYVPIEIEEKEIKKDEGKKKSTRKKSISSTMKKLIWNTHIGEEIGKSK
jgi:accessory gene regulator protein AgrB